MRYAAFLLFVSVLLSGCTTATRDSQNGNAPQAKTTVRVENQNFLDMTIYVLDAGQRIRLGDVVGHTTRVFEIPDHLIFGPTSLQFVADPVGARQTPVSEEITVTPGDQVQLIIP